MLQVARVDFFDAHKEFILYIIAGFILLYIAGAILNRVKHPKKGVCSKNVRVAAITKVRAQMNHRTAGPDGLSAGSAIPGAKFEVTFMEEDTSDLHIFALSESQCDKLQMGDNGVLLYNGNDFLSFERQGDVQDQVVKKRKIRRGIQIASAAIVVAVLAGMWLVGRQKVDEEKKKIEEQNMPVIQQANDEDLGYRR